ncbi:MAG TPA: hypothetical protein VN428_09185 [Bryobacteraceae bacterium]|nr:hypothetical protein [Bryobacteraceae bacterium]
MQPSLAWVPMRWPSDWRDPALLSLLKGSPINCLVLDWAAANANNTLAEAARAAGLAIVGLLGAQAEAPVVAAAELAGLAALGSAEPVQTRLPVIPWEEKSRLRWDSASPVLAASDGVWPGVQLGQGEEAGPTGLPWIDSNGWWLRLARARAPEKVCWVAAEPPADASFIRASHYALALADTYAHGGRLLLSLDPKLRAGLAARNESALDMWKAIMAALAFFTTHEEWAGLEPQGTIGVISSFAGEDEDFSGEILNLLARRGVPYRVYPKERAAAARFDGLLGIIYADRSAPEAALGARLQHFMENGGLLIAGAKWPNKPAVPSGTDVYRRFDVHKIGKGRLAVSKEDPADPFLVAGDAQLLLSFRNVPVRLFNTGTLNTFYTGTADGRRAMLHIINYAMRRFGHPASVAFTGKFRTAKMWTPEGPAKALDLAPTLDGGIEVHLPAFNLYAAVELEA